MDIVVDYNSDDFELCLSEYECESNNSNSDNVDNNIIGDISESQKNTISWSLIKQFATIDEAKLYIKDQKEWVHKTKNTLSLGYSIYYICMYANYRNNNKQDCKTACKLIYNYDFTDICLYISNIPHSCSNSYNITNEHKNIVRNCILLDIRTNPNRLNKEFIHSKLNTLNSKTISNLVYRVKKTIYNHISTHQEFSQFCKSELEKIVESDDQARVIGYKCEYNESCDSILRVLISTSRLLKIAENPGHVQIDGTYKLNVLGYPVILIGTSDCIGSFHPYGIALCSKETTQDYNFVFQELSRVLLDEFNITFNPNALLADASRQIAKSFKESFNGNRIQLMCYFHVIYNARKRMNLIKDKNTRNRLLNDIRMIHTSPNLEFFYYVFDLFKKNGLDCIQKLMNLFFILEIIGL